MKNILLSVAYSLGYCAFAFVLRKSCNCSSPADCYRSLFQLVLRVNGIYQLRTVKILICSNLSLSIIKSFFPRIQSVPFLFTSFCLADVSKNDAFHDSANRLPSSIEIARSWCRSVLLPTRTTGTLVGHTQKKQNYKSKFAHEVCKWFCPTSVYPLRPTISRIWFVPLRMIRCSLWNRLKHTRENPCYTELEICCTYLGQLCRLILLHNQLR